MILNWIWGQVGPLMGIERTLLYRPAVVTVYRIGLTQACTGQYVTVPRVLQDRGLGGEDREGQVSG